MGNLLAVFVHRANQHDTKAGLMPALQAYNDYPSIVKFCGDAGYRGTFVRQIEDFLGLKVDISTRNEPGFAVLPQRWVVERTFSWFGHSRRLSKDYEISTSSAEAMLVISHMHTLLKRLAS